MAIHGVPKFQATARVLLTGAVAAICGIAALTAWTIWDAHRVTETHAIQTSENLVATLGHDIQRNIEIYDLSLRTVIDGLKTPGIRDLPPDLRNRVLFDGAAGAEDLGAILVLDDSGKAIVDSRSTTPSHGDLSDQAYFQIHRDARDIGLYVSGPVKGRTNGLWVIALSRRIERPDGTFAGVVVGFMRLTYFKQLFNQVDVGVHGTINLFHADGTVMMRMPYDESDIGRNLAQATIFQLLPHAPDGHFYAVSQIDGLERLFVYHKLGDLPLVVSVAPATTALFAEWRQKTIFIVGGMLGLLTLITLLAFALRQQLRRTERSDARLVEAIESISEGFVIYDEDDRFVLCNDAYRRLYFENAAVMVAGTRYEDIMRTALAIGRYPDAKGREEEWLAEWMLRHRELRTAVESQLKDGRWVLTSERRMPSGGTAGLRVDITALKSVQESLRESQALLNLAQRVSRTGSVVRDFRNKRAAWSDELFRIFGVDRESFAPNTKMLLSLVHPEDRDKLTESIVASEKGIKPPPLQYRIIRPDGEVRWVYREADLMYDDNGTAIGRLSTYKDVTEQRAAELRQAELENQLRHSQRLEALGTLAGGVAHDLNNTLVPILALSKIAAKRLPTDSAERRELETIAQAGEQARDLVKQILAFSRKEVVIKQPVDLAALVREALKMLRASLPTTIQIVERIADVPRIHADAGQLKQVVTNLVTNAAQAIGEEFGTITVSVAPSSGTDAASGVCLTITDTGCGIDAADINRVFEPFFTTKDVGQGTGLGLAVVHGIVVGHGGRIECRSKRGEGSEFTVFLPTLTSEEAAPEMQPAA
jgi:PAS domain S-box-containing protein